MVPILLRSQLFRLQMKHQRLSAAIALACCVAACAGPTTVEEVKAGSGTQIETKTGLSVDEARARLAEAWHYCFNERGLVVSAGVYKVRTEGDPRNPLLVLRGGRSSILMMATFVSTADGQTQVIVQGAHGFMDKTARNTSNWLLHPGIPAFDEACQ